MPESNQIVLLEQAIFHQGSVIHGEKVGRTIGFPTANLDSHPNPAEVLPGVYFGNCQLVEPNTAAVNDCLVYFGPRYIFGEEVNSFEVFIYDFAQDLYGKTLAITLTHFQRSPVKVTSLEELQLLLEQDKQVGQTLRTTIAQQKD